VNRSHRPADPALSLLGPDGNLSAGLLESFRPYLLLIANEMVEADLRVKKAPSDVVQDTFLAAHRDRAQFRGVTPDELRSWLSAILRLKVAQLRRAFLDTNCRRLAREVSLEHVQVPATSDTPSDVIRRMEESETIASLLRDLPELQRQIVIGRIEDGLTFGEIGERLGMTEDAVRMAWGRCLKQLRGWLECSRQLASSQRL
jgi:RNA polymerase sigma-70 factor (ECF subfamily)